MREANLLEISGFSAPSGPSMTRERGSIPVDGTTNCGRAFFMVAVRRLPFGCHAHVKTARREEIKPLAETVDCFSLCPPKDAALTCAGRSWLDRSAEDPVVVEYMAGKEVSRRLEQLC
jgi:hypothetical protein